MYLVNHHLPNASLLLTRAEKLAMWFIETASSIDFADDKWEVLYVVKQGTESSPACLAGYCTLYTFHNPIKGSKMRVCQVLVPPPYQGKGLGREMLLQVYRTASARDFVIEVTVEDPAPAFQRLRDSVDVMWWHQTSARGVSSKLIPAQVEFVKFCAEFQQLLPAPATSGVKRSLEGLSPPPAVSQGGGPDMKNFRLRVKKHLLSLNGDLRGLSKADMQRELTALYGDMEGRFRAVCRKKWVWGC